MTTYAGHIVIGLAGFLALLAAPQLGHAQIAVVGSTIQERTVDLGESYSGSIAVVNETENEQNLAVYQTDYEFFADGRSPFDSAGTHPRSNASWVRPAVRTLRLPPRSRTEIAYTVTVPTVPLLGTYWSTIMIEPLGDLSSARPRSGSVSVGSNMRYAIQIVSHIGGGGSRLVTFPQSRLASNADAGRVLIVDVENAGERAYRPLLWIEIYDREGRLRLKVEQQRGLVYPGSSIRQSFTVGVLSTGSYKAVVYADTGEESVFVAEFRLEI